MTNMNTNTVTYTELRDRQQQELNGLSMYKDPDSFRQTLDRHINELAEAIANDATGDGFIYQMFLYELYDHEYPYGDLNSTLYAMGYSRSAIEADPRLKRGLDAAVTEILAAHAA